MISGYNIKFKIQIEILTLFHGKKKILDEKVLLFGKIGRSIRFGFVCFFCCNLWLIINLVFTVKCLKFFNKRFFETWHFNFNLFPC